MSQGWVKLFRELSDKPIWKDSTPEQCKILVTLLLMANHKEAEWEWKGEKYIAKPGQFITSLEKIVEKNGKGVTIQNVRTALKRFEKMGFLTNESTNKNRLITIVNWDFYQNQDGEPNKQPNRQLTSNQQATNKQLTTNKNDKNVKNDKELDNNDDNAAAYIFNFYQENFGMINPFMADKLDHWLNDVGDELLLEAMRRALKRSMKFNYAEKILQQWTNSNVKSITDVQALDKEFERRKGVKFNANNQGNDRLYADKYDDLLPF